MKIESILLLQFAIILSVPGNCQNCDLIAHYKFSGNAKDEMKVIDGIVSGAWLSTDRFGNENAAYVFSQDSGSVISLGDNFDFFSEPDSKFAFSFWFQWTDTSKSNVPIISKYGNGSCGENQREFYINININKKPEFLYFSSVSGSSYRGIEGSTIITDTNWHHIVVNYDGSMDSNNGIDRVEIYLDGDRENLNLFHQGGNIGNIQNSSAHLGIGSPLNSMGSICAGATNAMIFEGKLDDIRIYNNTLMETEVINLFNDTSSTDTCYNITIIDTITVYNTVYDTIPIYDTITYFDIITVHDTITLYDIIKVHDTISVYDTISITDTLIIDFLLEAEAIPGNPILKVYPNPVSDILHIEISDPDLLNDHQIRIIGMSGSTIFETVINEEKYNIDLSSLTESGIYNLIITDKDFNPIVVKKLVFY